MSRNPKVPNFVIVVFPPKKVIQSINKLKEKNVDKKYSPSLSFPIKLYDFPHLTVKRKFVLKPGIVENQIIHLIESVLENFPILELETDKIKLFKKPDKNTVYLQIKNNPKLSRLVNEIQRVLKPTTTTYEPTLDANFSPHLSILWQISDEELAQVERIFEEDTPIFKFEMDKFYLLKSSKKFGGYRELAHIFNLM